MIYSPYPLIISNVKESDRRSLFFISYLIYICIADIFVYTQTLNYTDLITRKCLNICTRELPQHVDMFCAL